MSLRASKAAKAVRNRLRDTSELGRGIASYSAPTPERRSKAVEGWAVDERPGGLKTYRALTPYEANERHFSDREQAAALRFVRDLELAGRIRIVSTRAYDGMPYVGPGDGNYLRSQAQLAAAERVDWILAHMDERWLAFLDVVVCGVQYALQDRPLTLDELGGRISRFTGKDQRRGFALGFAKGAFVRLDEAYAAWDVERRRRDQEIERRRAAELAAKADTALVTVQKEWAAERERALAGNGRSVLLQEYDRVVLGKRGDC
jgi:hypothetical protein